LTDHVGAGQGNGNRQCLDGERGRNTHLVKGLDDRIQYAETGKGARRLYVRDNRAWAGLIAGFASQNFALMLLWKVSGSHAGDRVARLSSDTTARPVANWTNSTRRWWPC